MPVKGSRRKKKEQTVEKLTAKLKGAKILAIADLRNLPDRQLQLVKKKLRGNAEFFVTKTSLIKLALEKAKVGSELLTYLDNPSALIISKIDPFRLFAQIKKNKGKAAAKPGQIAPFEIVVPAGETSLPPGPVLSELKQAGIAAQIAGGKVVVGKDSVVAKAGEKITDMKAKALQKLGIEPFEVSVNVVAVWDNGLVYKQEVLNVDVEQYKQNLAAASANALNLSVFIAYPTKENIRLLIAKAYGNARSLALNADIYEKDVIDLLLAKANAQASAIKSKVGELPSGSAEAQEAAPAPEAPAAAPASEEKPKEEKKEDKKE
ncbi:MAG: 50S ribosomal protein L10 [Candidatus Micrarchaeota archaeon]